jgi:hypothetical protein
MVQHDVVVVPSLSHSDANLIDLACTQMAHCMGQPGPNYSSAVMPLAQFGLIEEVVADVRAKTSEKRLISCSIAGMAAPTFQPLLPDNLRCSDWNTIIVTV